MPWIHDLIADKPATAPAIIDFDEARYSYGDLRRMVDQTAAALAAHGVRPGDRVMIVAENCAMYPVAVFACSQLKAWVNPVNARQSHQELEAIAQHSGARAMLFTANASDAAMAHANAFAAQNLADLACGPLLVSPIAQTTPEIVDDTPETRTAALIYTTGTTSAPKGVMLTHANLCWNANTSANLRGLTGDDRVIGVLPGTHIFGFSSSMLATFRSGAELQFLSRFTPESVLKALAQGGSVMPAVPQMYAHLIAYLDSHNQSLDAPRLRYISSGGAPLDPDLKHRTEAVFGLPLHNGMGMTECSPTMAATRRDAPATDTSVGKAVDGVTLWIDTPDDKGVGELMVKSPGMMKGYYHNPDATAAILQNGILHSGDLAQIAEDGTVHIVGRLKELIIRSGFNVYPPELEAMLTKHPSLTQAAVVGRQMAGDEQIVAFVLARTKVSEQDIKDWLHSRLTAYKVPQRICIVDAFPTAATGKILKHKLLSHFSDILA